MSIPAPKPATTPIPVHLSEDECTAFLLPHLAMPKWGPKCTLGYHHVFNLICGVSSEVSANLLYRFGQCIQIRIPDTRILQCRPSWSVYSAIPCMGLPHAHSAERPAAPCAAAENVLGWLGAASTRRPGRARMVKIIMRPHAHSISGVLRAAHGTESGRHGRLIG
jgi:hypothetical protein